MKNPAQLFQSYKIKPQFYDEFFSSENKARPLAQNFIQEFNNLPLQDIERAHSSISQFFQTELSAFNVPKERALSMDIIPSLLNQKDWDHIKKGLSQRLKALNLFLKDIYTKEQILKEGLVPKDLVYESPHFLKEMKGVKIPFDIYIQILGSNIVRTSEGFFVGVSQPSPQGSFYLILSRRVMKQKFPRLFRKCNVKKTDGLIPFLKSLKSLSEEEKPFSAILSPGPSHPHYFEMSCLSRQMGIEMIQSADLTIHEGGLYVKTIKKLKKIHVVFCPFDIFYPPLAFPDHFAKDILQLFSTNYPASITPVPGAGVACDRSIYSYIPKIIQYYLKEESLLPNIPTQLCREKKHLEQILQDLPKLIVKRLTESENFFIGPKSSKKEREIFKEQLKAHPKDFIAQTLLPISTSPCFIDGEIKPRHISLRMFTWLNRFFEVGTVPGGFCQAFSEEEDLFYPTHSAVALKDLWLLKEEDYAFPRS